MMEKRKIKYKVKSGEFSGVVFDAHEYNINVHSREIFLHSYHHNDWEDEEPGMDYRMTSVFIKNMRLLNNQGPENILIHQQSCGGDWNYGMAIYDAIIASEAPVVILAYGQARSMSSITLQAAKRRVLMPDCDVLIHHGTLGFDDRVTPVVSAVKYAEDHDKKRMLEIYANRCVTGKYFKQKHMKIASVTKFILKKMQEKTDWIMSAKQAVSYGFADGILGTTGFKTISSIRSRI